MATQFQTYSKSFEDKSLGATIEATLNSTTGKLEISLKSLDGTLLGTKQEVALGAVSNVEYVNDTTNPTSLKITYADSATPTYVELTGLATKLVFNSTDETLELKHGDTVLSTVSNVVFTEASQTLTNKTIDVDNNTVSNIETDNFKSGVLQTSVRDSSTATDTALASEKAIRTELDKAVTDVKVDNVTVVTDHVAEIPKASSSAFGVIKVDNDTIKSDNGLISADKYTIKKLADSETTTGYLNTYQLYRTKVDGTDVAIENAKIDIPKDFLVKSASVKTWDGSDPAPEEMPTGAVSGDKYLDFVVNVKSGTATNEHIYILVKDMGNVYSAGDGITIGSDNKIGAVADSTNGVQVTTSGIGIADDGVTTAKIADSNVTEAKLATDSVTTVKIKDANVTTDKIADSNVTTAKIADSNVTTDKIADSNVTTDKIADSNVTTAKIADSNVTEAKLATDSVTTVKIKDDNVAEAKLTEALRQKLYEVAWETTAEDGVIKFTSLA